MWCSVVVWAVTDRSEVWGPRNMGLSPSRTFLPDTLFYYQSHKVYYVHGNVKWSQTFDPHGLFPVGPCRICLYLNAQQTEIISHCYSVVNRCSGVFYFSGISNNWQLCQCKATEDCVWDKQWLLRSCDSLYAKYCWNAPNQSKRLRCRHKFLTPDCLLTVVNILCQDQNTVAT